MEGGTAARSPLARLMRASGAGITAGRPEARDAGPARLPHALLVVPPPASTARRT
ncbi:hypothetical protein ACFT5C_30555 [Streptomyces sp. NPDC057116]|uniref:hypothetical protein n=1 Tax=Streptomyces sp. NPDC057116 TaxID=3346023 RepID=UPI0036294678